MKHGNTFLIQRPGVHEDAFKTLLAYRRASNRDLVTWLHSTRWEARAAVRREVDVDPTLFVRKSNAGWSIIRARDLDEASQVEALLAQSMQQTASSSPPSLSSEES
jgi:hypothetical protein